LADSFGVTAAGDLESGLEAALVFFPDSANFNSQYPDLKI